MKKVRVLSIDINSFSKKVFKDELISALKSDKNMKIAKVNTEFLLRAKNDKEFGETLVDFEIKIADGSGVLWAAKYLSLPLIKVPILKYIQAIWQMVYTGASLVVKPSYCKNPIPERFPGMEAFYLMLESVVEAKSPVYFFGAGEESLNKALTKIQRKYPDLKVAGSHEGYDYLDKEMVQDINKSGARLLIVALGSPKQEYWIRDNIEKLQTVKVAVGEGGTLEYIAGSFKRAPRWMRKIGLEWLWRAFMNKDKTESSRLRRVWQAVPVFILTVVKYKMHSQE